MEAELYRAATSGSIEAMRGISNWKEQKTPNNNNVLHLHVGISSLFKVVRRTKRQDAMVDSEFINYVLNDDDGYCLLWEENSDGDTPLHLAARFGHSNAVEAFLERANKVYQPTEEVARILSITNNKERYGLAPGGSWWSSRGVGAAGGGQPPALIVAAIPSPMRVLVAAPLSTQPYTGETPFQVKTLRNDVGFAWNRA